MTDTGVRAPWQPTHFTTWQLFLQEIRDSSKKYLNCRLPQTIHRPKSAIRLKHY